MFLWPNKESIHVKQASDVINSIFGVFQNNLCFTGCPKKSWNSAFFSLKDVIFSFQNECSRAKIKSIWKKYGHHILSSISLEYKINLIIDRVSKKKVEIQPISGIKFVTFYLQYLMFLWPNKESFHKKQTSDVINCVLYRVSKKKVKIQSFFYPKRCHFCSSRMNVPGSK